MVEADNAVAEAIAAAQNAAVSTRSQQQPPAAGQSPIGQSAIGQSLEPPVPPSPEPPLER